jgi:predicted dehydrogenase
MGKLPRRNFIKSSVLTCTGTLIAGTLATQTPFARIKGANDDIRVAVVGIRGQGRSHLNAYRNLPGVRITALCDVDGDVLDGGMQKSNDLNEKVVGHKDIRKLLEDDNIDVVSIATPNHWHSLMTIWACQAGKDVCVEKPVSHNIWEGRKMVEAARKYNCLVQADLDRRSNEGLHQAIEYIHKGKLGKILWIRAFDYKRRKSIGKVNSPQSIPEHIDYDLWTGPALKGPLMRKNLHYDWHWVWSTGCGELGNNGPHQLDICRWALNEDGLPSGVMSFGGRFGYVDDGETPNTQVVIYDYPTAPIIYESRGLPRNHGASMMDDFAGVNSIGKPIRIKHESPNPFDDWVMVCQHGYMHGTVMYDNDGKEIKRFERQTMGPQANFIKAVRSRKQSDLRSDILVGHISTALSHMGNISYRLGAKMPQGEIIERIQTNKQLTFALERFNMHLSRNKIDIEKSPISIGPWLTFDPEWEKFKGEFSDQANNLLSRDYREPFVVPQQV